MRPHGQTKLGFFPLPVAEAKRLKNWLIFPERFSALDPRVGDARHSSICFRTWPAIASSRVRLSSFRLTKRTPTARPPVAG